MIRPDGQEGREADDTTELSKTEARAGITPHVTRYVLGTSLLLAIIAMAIILSPAS